MTIIEYQDSDIIVLNPYTFSGTTDIWIKVLHPYWSQSIVNDDYKVLINRQTRKVIQAINEYYASKYSALEPSLVGDVLILGAGLQHLDMYLTTGTSWKWVEKNPFLAALTPANGTVYEGDANDIEFLTTLGTFDTILIDCELNDPLLDLASLLNPAGTIIEFQL